MPVAVYGPISGQNSFINRSKLPLTVAQTLKNCVTSAHVAATTVASATASLTIQTPTVSSNSDKSGYLIKNGTSYFRIHASSVASEEVISTETRVYFTNPQTGTTTDSFAIRGAHSANNGNFYSLSLIPPPNNVTLATAATGSVANGTYKYVFTYVDRFGNESGPSVATSTVTVSSGPKKIQITNLPLGPVHVSARNIYRINDGVTVAYQFVAQVSDNTTTSYDDKLANADLGDDILTDGFTVPSHAQLKPMQSAIFTAASSGAGDVDGRVHYVIVSSVDTTTAPYEQWAISDTVGFVAATDTVTLTISNYQSAISYFLYRLDEDTASRKWRYVATFAASTYADNIAPATLATAAYYGSRAETQDFEFIAGPHHGMLFTGWRNTGSWSKQGNYTLFNPTEYYQKFNGLVRNAIPFNGEMVYLTTQGLSRLVGDEELNLTRIDVPNTAGAISPYAVATPVGIVYFDVFGYVSLWPGGDSPSIPIGKEVIAAGTITPARMTYINGQVYIAGNTGNWVIDVLSSPPNWMQFDYGYNIAHWYHDQTRLYFVLSDNGGTTYQFPTANDEPARVSGAGPALTLTGAELMGSNPEAHKYFRRWIIDYQSDGNVSMEWFKDGSSYQTYTLPTTSSTRTRTSVWFPVSSTKTCRGRGIYPSITTANGITATIFELLVYWDENEKP